MLVCKREIEDWGLSNEEKGKKRSGEEGRTKSRTSSADGPAGEFQQHHRKKARGEKKEKKNSNCHRQSCPSSSLPSTLSSRFVVKVVRPQKYFLALDPADEELEEDEAWGDRMRSKTASLVKDE